MDVAGSVAALDFSKEYKSICESGVSALEARQMIEEYRRFLTLFLEYEGRTFVPNERVDTVWHQHLADPEKYKEDCRHVFGTTLEHDADFYGTEAFKIACKETEGVFQSRFGAPFYLTSNAALCAGMRSPSRCGGMLQNSN